MPNETAVCGGVPPADGRAGPVGAHAGGSGAGVRAVGPGHPEPSAQAGRDAGERTDGLRTEEREEMRRLRGRNRPLYAAGLSSSDLRNRRTPSNAS